MQGPERVTTPDGVLEVRKVHPFQARKQYLCPGCNQEIRVASGHVVVVPLGAPEDRRHWHHPCWDREATVRTRPRRR